MDNIIFISLFLVMITCSVVLSLMENKYYKNGIVCIVWLVIAMIYTIAFSLYIAGIFPPRNEKFVSISIRLCFLTLLPVLLIVFTYSYRLFFRSKGKDK